MLIGVVGRGIVGQAIAFELIRLGFEVILIGPRETEEAASRCALGLASMKGLLLPRDPLFKAKFKGHYLFPKWLNTVNQHLDAKHRIAFFRGHVYEPYQDSLQYQKIRQRAFSASYTGLFPIEERREQRAFRYPFDYWFCTRELLHSLDSLNVRRAKAVYNNFFVNKIIKLDCGDYEVSSACGLELKLPALVLAAGVSTVDILRNSRMLHLNQKRIAGHSLYANAEFLNKQTSIFAAASLNIYEGHAYFGSTSYDLDKNNSLDDRAQDVIKLRSKLKEIYPNDFQWQGLYGVRSRLADRQPAIGPVSSQNRRLVIATGLYKNGFALAPLIAKGIGLYFKENKTGFVPKIFEDFSPNRKNITLPA